jgi:hypothetical protein
MMKKILTLLLLASLQLFATQYNSTVFDIEAKLFPKMVMLSRDLDQEDKYLDLYILTQERDEHYAQEFKSAIETNYTHELRNKIVRVSIKQFQNLKKLPDAVIVLQHSPKELEEIALWANTHKIISLAYDPSYMDYGILGSLYIGITTKPYLNKEIIKKYRFSFNPYLLELSKFK